MGESPNAPDNDERRSRLDELRAELVREHERLKALQDEIASEVAQHQAPPPRRFKLLPGGLGTVAVVAGAELVRKHRVGLSLVTAVSALAFLLLPSSTQREAPHVALPPATVEPRPPEAQPERPRKSRRRWPPNEVEPATTSIEPVAATAAPPAIRRTTTTTAPRPAEPPATTPPPPQTDVRPTPAPAPEPRPRPCLRVAAAPPEIDADLEQCIDKIVGYLNAA